jgi:ornithine carbamoyltransferase
MPYSEKVMTFLDHIQEKFGSLKKKKCTFVGDIQPEKTNSITIIITEKDKMQQQMLYDANYDTELIREQQVANR